MQPAAEYYGYGESAGWDMHQGKMKQEPQQDAGYQHTGYGELSHVHQLSQVVPPYQESPVVEDGEFLCWGFVKDACFGVVILCWGGRGSRLMNILGSGVLVFGNFSCAETCIVLRTSVY